jgi:AdoMet-dependent heme synthase
MKDLNLSNEIIIGKENNQYFLINKRSGDYFEINQKNKKIIDNISSIKLNKQITPFIKNLLKEGIVVDKKKNEKDDSFHVQWHLTERCNLRCTHCYQEGKKQRELEEYEMKNFVDHFIYVLKKQKMSGSISLTGGEPLILGEKLWNLIKYIRKSDLDIEITLLTNGTLITNTISDKLKKYNIYCQISFDGPDEKTHENIRGKGNFSKALRGVRLLKKKDIPVSAHFVIMRQNIKNIEKMINLCIDNKIKRLTFSRLVPLGRGAKLRKQMLSPTETKEIFYEIYNLSKKFKNDLSINTGRTLWCNLDNKVGGTCPAGFSSLTVNADGSVYPCRRLPIIVGNILENSIFEIWYGSKMINLRNRKKIDKCGKCKLIDRCGGCRAIAYAYFGDYMAADPQCWKIHSKLPEIKNLKK